MSIVRDQPVMWVETVTLLASGSPYDEQGMQAWNRSLLAACSATPTCGCSTGRYARRGWFIPDGIHYYSPGYVARAHFISLGLAHAFPAAKHSALPGRGAGRGRREPLPRPLTAS